MYKKAVVTALIGLFWLVFMYMGIACAIFKTRHPYAGDGAVLKHLAEVVRFDVVPAYQ